MSQRSEDDIPVLDAEVVDEEKEKGFRSNGSSAEEPVGGRTERWFHPLACLLMMAMDFGGTLGDVAGVYLYILMPLVIAAIFLVATGVVTLVQRFLEGDSWKSAVAKGAVAGALCAVPLPVFGTLIGGYLLLRSGVSELSRGGLMGMFKPAKNRE